MDAAKDEPALLAVRAQVAVGGSRGLLRARFLDGGGRGLLTGQAWKKRRK